MFPNHDRMQPLSVTCAHYFRMGGQNLVFSFFALCVCCIFLLFIFGSLSAFCFWMRMEGKQNLNPSSREETTLHANVHRGKKRGPMQGSI